MFALRPKSPKDIEPFINILPDESFTSRDSMYFAPSSASAFYPIRRQFVVEKAIRGRAERLPKLRGILELPMPLWPEDKFALLSYPFDGETAEQSIYLPEGSQSTGAFCIEAVALATFNKANGVPFSASQRVDNYQAKMLQMYENQAVLLDRAAGIRP